MNTTYYRTASEPDYQEWIYGEQRIGLAFKLINWAVFKYFCCKTWKKITPPPTKF